MRVIVKDPGREARAIEIDGSLRSLQNLVGGNIEHIGLTDKLGILCDENGKMYGRELNFRVSAINDWIVGTAVFVGEDGEEFTSINEEDEKQVLAFLDLCPRIVKEEE